MLKLSLSFIYLSTHHLFTLTFCCSQNTPNTFLPGLSEKHFSKYTLASVSHSFCISAQWLLTLTIFPLETFWLAPPHSFHFIFHMFLLHFFLFLFCYFLLALTDVIPYFISFSILNILIFKLLFTPICHFFKKSRMISCPD